MDRSLYFSRLYVFLFRVRWLLAAAIEIRRLHRVNSLNKMDVEMSLTVCDKVWISVCILVSMGSALPVWMMTLELEQAPLVL